MLDPLFFFIGILIGGCIGTYLSFISPNKEKYLDKAEKILGLEKK